MATTPADVQAKLDAAMNEIEQATSSPAKMVAAHGPDPNNWTAGHLKTGFLDLLGVRDEVGQLQAPVLTAAFAAKES